jgi:hypothetical protein
MTQTATIRFVDPKAGESVATIEQTEAGVAVHFSTAAQPTSTVCLPVADAAKFAHAVLAAAGQDFEQQRPQLPQSRQIGGIIGPY